ncbi:MAG TPA: hypothetical protein VM238_14290 [Phycisphaerae bacterium]|nr:hypothetical protein [Phycisphaerae bacterium]HUU92364.1 hypothetical protein [Phycisphaerae bacterium]
MSRGSAKPLSIRQANRIAAGRVRVSTDPIDATLWRVEDDEATEVHEPMTRDRWVAFLKTWVR